MAWDIQQIMEMAAKSGLTLTREQAALQEHCFNEATKRGVSPLTIVLELMQRNEAEQNLGRINPDSGLAPKKPSWQL